MAESKKIPKKVVDKSSDKGFQFEFICDRCDTGYLSKPQSSTAETISNVLDSASDALSGILQQVAEIGQQVATMAGKKSREAALETAVEEMADSFAHCPICSRVVCRKKCWDSKKGNCEDCAKSTGAFAPGASDDHEQESKPKQPKKPAPRPMQGNPAGSTQRCPKCEKTVEAGAKFCPHCGAKITAAAKCPSCHAVLKPGAKFCSECGKKITK